MSQRLQAAFSRDQTWSRRPTDRGIRAALRDQVWSRLVCVFAVALTQSGRCSENAPLAEHLTALADKCDEQGLKEQAESTRAWSIPRHPGRQYLFLPLASEPGLPKGGDAVAASQWHKRFKEIRGEQAARLFAAAEAASARAAAAEAYQLLYETLRENPEHAEARRVLGYVKSPRGQWQLPDWEKMVVRRSATDQPKLGWRAGSFSRLETPHFQIVTNHSPAEALELGKQLEDLHALWRQIFYRYWSTPAALAARLAGRNEAFAPERPKMQVVLFKSRAEYLKQLASAAPQIGLTLGVYLHHQRTTFIYAGDKSVYPIWYHEVTHQLFQEAVPNVVDEPARTKNFWAVEAAALYMESLTEQAGYWSAGGCEADRLQLARYRALAGDFVKPLAELAPLGREALQASPDIRKLYTQAAGYAHFFCDGQHGKHRDAFIQLLTAIYRGADSPGALAEAAGQTLGTLDQQYRAFLNVTDADLAGIPGPKTLRNLSLGGTSVTDQGLAHLARCQNLEWLDLAGTSVSDAGLAHVVGATNLKQLFLEKTKITDASLPRIAAFKKLEELDLSRLDITDDGLAALAALKNLKILHLTGSPISDAGLVHLRGLKQLETLATEGTKITPAGLKQLQANLPKLKLTTAHSSLK